MRKKKNLDKRIEDCTEWLIPSPAALKGHWLVDRTESKLFVEIGCGKGRFTVETAMRNPDALFVAVERVADALVIAMERAKRLQLNNLLFICEDVSNLSDYFDRDEIDRLYINFCDPWPSKRHASRRLVHEIFLKSYYPLLNKDGEIHFKTDNKPLFDFSLTQFPRAGYEVTDITHNLHIDNPGVVMTDFEAVFHEQGTKINFCIGHKSTMPISVTPEPLQSLLDYWMEGDPIPRGMDEVALIQRANERKLKEQYRM